MPTPKYEVAPTPEIEEELRRSPVSFDALIKESLDYLEDPDVQDMALARMYIERGFSEEFAYWLVREAEVRHAAH
jgi:hypothetical protein